jgi:hypothetical protein
MKLKCTNSYSTKHTLFLEKKYYNIYHYDKVLNILTLIDEKDKLIDIELNNNDVIEWFFEHFIVLDILLLIETLTIKIELGI